MSEPWSDLCVVVSSSVDAVRQKGERTARRQASDRRKLRIIWDSADAYYRDHDKTMTDRQRVALDAMWDAVYASLALIHTADYDRAMTLLHTVRTVLVTTPPGDALPDVALTSKMDHAPSDAALGGVAPQARRA